MVCRVLSNNFGIDEAMLVEEHINLGTDASGNVKDMRLWMVRDAHTSKAKYVGGACRTASNNHYLTNVYGSHTQTFCNELDLAQSFRCR